MVITPAGRDPGMSRAERGRSLQPVASTTAGGSTSRRPAGPVSFSRPASQPVTIVSASTSTPASVASSR